MARVTVGPIIWPEFLSVFEHKQEEDVHMPKVCQSHLQGDILMESNDKKLKLIYRRPIKVVGRIQKLTNKGRD